MPKNDQFLFVISFDLFWFQQSATSSLVVKISDAAAAVVAAEKERNLRRMQQMAAASNMGILNPFVFNQFGTYGFAAAQVSFFANKVPDMSGFGIYQYFD